MTASLRSSFDETLSVTDQWETEKDGDAPADRAAEEECRTEQHSKNVKTTALRR